MRTETLGVEETPGAVFGTRASFGRYAHGWATLCNTPFRRHKAEGHAGGNTTPLIVRWPARLRDAGMLTEQVGHIIDIAPTCLAAAGLSQAGKPPGEGINLLPLCRRGAPGRSRRLYWEHQGNRAVLDGDWKLVSLHQQD